MGEQVVRMTWYVKNQHQRDFTPVQWQEFVDSLREGLPTGMDTDSLDLVYDHLERSGFEASTVLHELATPNTWVDNDVADVSDITVEQAHT